MKAVTTHERIDLEEGEVLIVPLKTFVLAPEDAVIVRASVVAATAGQYGTRGAAELYGTSASTISRFLRQNGYSQRWLAGDKEEHGE